MIERVPCTASGRNGMGGAGMTLAMVDSSSGAASAAAMNPAITSGVAGRRSMPPTIAGNVMEPVLEPGRDAEVPAAAADRPEEVRIMVGIDDPDLAVGGDQLGGQQVVDGQAVLPSEIADAAAEGDPAEPHRPRIAEAGREPVGAGRLRIRAGGQPGAGPRRPPFDVDLERLEVAHVEDDPAVAHAQPAVGVAAAPHGQLEPGLAGDPDDMGHVGCVGDPDDDRRSAVDVAGEDAPHLVVLGVVGGDDPAGHAGAQSGNGEVGGLGCRYRHDGLLMRASRTCRALWPASRRTSSTG